MARTKTTQVSDAPKETSVAEIKDFYEKNKDRIANFATAEEALRKLTDVSKDLRKNVNVYSREDLRNALRNIGSSQARLRDISWYLYYRVSIYWRIVNFYANQIDLNTRSVIPEYDPTKEEDSNKTLTNYFKTLRLLDSVDWNHEFFNVLLTAWIQDVSYNCVWWEDDQFFLLPLPAQYCKIVGKYGDGTFMFAFDYSYFRSNQDLLEIWGEPFKSEYEAYIREGNSGKWRIFPLEHTVCIKQRSNEWDMILPPFLPLFNDLLGLVGVQDLEAIRDEQDIFKLILLKLPRLGKTIDDWGVDPSLVVQYFNKMVDEALPDYTSAAIVPTDVEVIEFNSNDTTADTNRTNKALKNILDSSGGGEILLSSNISGSTAYSMVKILNTEFAISSLLPQISATINRLVKQQFNKACKIKFFEVSTYTREDLRKEFMNSAEYGFPNALAYGTTLGLSELDTLSLNHLEKDILNLTERFVPLQSSHTQSGDGEVGQGAPTKDEVTDEGDRSRENKGVNG